jgi:hypothetical protein
MRFGRPSRLGRGSLAHQRNHGGGDGEADRDDQKSVRVTIAVLVALRVHLDR